MIVRAYEFVKFFNYYSIYCSCFIWRTLLEVPQSAGAFQALVSKGVHQRAALLHSKFPITDAKLSRGLLRYMPALESMLLSALISLFPS